MFKSVYVLTIFLIDNEDNPIMSDEYKTKGKAKRKAKKYIKRLKKMFDREYDYFIMERSELK